MLADSVGLALLVVLESLGPSERLAFVLHDLFAVPFDEIGQILGKSTAAAKMLASRARRKVQAIERPTGVGREQREVVHAFLAAARRGGVGRRLDRGGWRGVGQVIVQGLGRPFRSYSTASSSSGLCGQVRQWKRLRSLPDCEGSRGHLSVAPSTVPAMSDELRDGGLWTEPTTADEWSSKAGPPVAPLEPGVRRGEVMYGAGGSPFTPRSAGGLDNGAGEKHFTGDFETHPTVRLRNGEETSLVRWAEHNGVKYSRIVLDRGETPDQAMLTTSGRGTLVLQRAVAGRYVGQLRCEGFEVTRVESEAAPWNKDVPQTVWEAAQLPPQRYFEHHVKPALADVGQVAAVRTLCELPAAHVSRNARLPLSGGRRERFVTQRCRLVGRPAARARLDALLVSLADVGFVAAEVEEECVVHDDNLVVDAGRTVADGSGAAR